jgi:hypothetical protein
MRMRWRNLEIIVNNDAPRETHDDDDDYDDEHDYDDDDDEDDDDNDDNDDDDDTRTGCKGAPCLTIWRQAFWTGHVDSVLRRDGAPMIRP